MTHTEIGWMIFAVALVGMVFSSVPAQSPVVTVDPQPAPQPPEEIGSVSVESVDKPSDAPRSVTVEASGACSDGSCGTQRRFLGLFRRR